MLGSIANHTAAKDLGVLIETMNKIVHEHGIENIRLIQMGDFSKLTPGFKSMIAEKKLDEYIIMTDFQKNAFSFLPQFDTFVVTSEREGGPSSLVEALYYKAPIVSTRVLWYLQLVLYNRALLLKMKVRLPSLKLLRTYRIAVKTKRHSFESRSL